jgi:hypothetical protein
MPAGVEAVEPPGPVEHQGESPKSLADVWPQVLDFFGTPPVIEPMTNKAKDWLNFLGCRKSRIKASSCGS